MSGHRGAEDFLDHILVDTCGNFAWKSGSMTNEATGVVCPGYHVGIFLGIGFSIPEPGLECLARLVDLPKLWITCL